MMLVGREFELPTFGGRGRMLRTPWATYCVDNYGQAPIFRSLYAPRQFMIEVFTGTSSARPASE